MRRSSSSSPKLLVLAAAVAASLATEPPARAHAPGETIILSAKARARADGKVNVVKAGRNYQLVASNDLGESIASSPIVADGTLYLRTYDALYAIRSDKAAAAGTAPRTQSASIAN